MSVDLMALAERTVLAAKKRGASDAAVTAAHGRSISVQMRDGELEQVREAASTSLGVSLYVDGRYSTHSTNDLRDAAVDAFLDRTIALTRLLSEDPNRGLADPELYANRPDDDLEIFDSAYEGLDTARRTALAEAAMEAARGTEGPLLSVTSGYSDSVGESVRVHSNGFTGRRKSTRFGLGVEVTVQDEGDRRPEAWDAATVRRFEDLEAPEDVGRRAAERALARLGQRKLPSGTMPIVLDPRAAPSLLRHFVGALGGAAIEHRRSFLLGKEGERVGSDLFHLVDDPLLPRGLASRHYDGDGISARRRTLVEDGVLRGFCVDVYYGRKLGVPPTGGSLSNLVLRPGERTQDELVSGLARGVLVTGILGGNADATSGDFSHGIVGFAIADGTLVGPVGEMNVTGSHRSFWERLIDVGNDPYPYSSYRIPTLVFDDVSVSGA